MGKKEEKTIKLVEMKIFEFMVENEVELYKEGLYDHPELPAEQIEVTEEIADLLAAGEAYERMMRVVLEISGNSNPWAILEKSMQAWLVAQKIVGAPNQKESQDKFNKSLQDFTNTYKEIQQKEKRFFKSLN